MPIILAYFKKTNFFVTHFSVFSIINNNTCLRLNELNTNKHNYLKINENIRKKKQTNPK
ncbi:hypothetical protein SAMN05428642_101308 [Flaviramulus basaltis]|uniref:Uncharacterized protein n=1 Tax=Flaviramulus basaltis TaxID=369401 RepID=A0A1K2IAP4_9FLAO|nr:hypothetical protein SAMN05428642_101308 [Flaviramulus basaltis]